MDPKTGFTGAVLVVSFRMFRLLMAVFKVGIALLRPFCRWELSVMVEMQDEYREVARKSPSGNTAVCVSIGRFVQNRPKNVVYLLIVLEPGTLAS